MQYRGQHVGILPDGTVKEPGRTGTGKHAQFTLSTITSNTVSYWSWGRTVIYIIYPCRMCLEWQSRWEGYISIHLFWLAQCIWPSIHIEIVCITKSMVYNVNVLYISHVHNRSALILLMDCVVQHVTSSGHVCSGMYHDSSIKGQWKNTS